MISDGIRVYVAGPISKGDTEWNVLCALTTAEKLLKEGMIPYVPHLTVYWNRIYQHSWEEWLNMDEQWLLLCDALIRIAGESRGAEREEKFAASYGIPVFHTIGALKKWAKKKR